MQEEAWGEVDWSHLERDVAQYWDQGTGWRWEELSQHLPMTSMVSLASRTLGPKLGREDKMSWIMANGEKFTIKSAYQLAYGLPKKVDWGGWKRV